MGNVRASRRRWRACLAIGIGLSAACGEVLTAEPDAAPDVTLTVTVAGPGTVTSSPAGIDCGATCTLGPR